MKKNKNKGISIIEILIVVSIVAIVSIIVIPNFSNFRNQQVLKNTTEDIVSLLNEARNSTISSKGSTNYGVYFESDKVILFSGMFYSPSSSNKQIELDSSVNIPEVGGVNLENGGDEIVFTRITGDTLEGEYGNIVIQLISDSSKQKTINVSKIGVIGSN